MTARGASTASQRRKNGEEGSQEGRGQEAGSEEAGREEDRREEALVAVAATALRRQAANGCRPRVASASWTCGGYQSRPVAAGHFRPQRTAVRARHSRVVSAAGSVASAGVSLRAAGQGRSTWKGGYALAKKAAKTAAAKTSAASTPAAKTAAKKR